MREPLRALAFAGACLLFLIMALGVQDVLFRSGLEYYLQMTGQPGWLPLCEMDTLFQQLGASRPGGTVFAGACDAVLVTGLVAVGGFLAFLTVYVLYSFLVRALLALVPESWHTGALILASAVFLLVALPLRPAIWLLELAVVLLFAAALPVPPRLRAVLLAGLLVGFYVFVGASILQLTETFFFDVHTLPGEGRGASPRLAGLLEFLNLGRPGVPHQDGEGFPYLLPALGLLVTLPRRVAWVAWELWVGRIRRVPLAPLFLYLLGLPFLIGNAASPSFEEFRKRPDPVAAGRSGWRTLAGCLGFGALLYTVLVGLGFSPAVRLLFPRCDLEQVTPFWVWGRLILTYVIAFLYLYGTEQTSVGMCRLFGYSVRDNYERPLSARNVGDFWRRWNVLWREFLMSVFFFPTALALARRAGGPRRWHAAAAVAVTFLGTWFLNALPLLLLALGGRMAYTDATHPGPGLTTALHGTRTDDSFQVTALLPALALYYALEAAAVVWNLSWEGRSRRLPRVVAVIATLLFIACTRVLLDPSLAMSDKLAMVSRALFQ